MWILHYMSPLRLHTPSEAVESVPIAITALPPTSRHKAQAEIFLTDEFSTYCVTGQTFVGVFVFVWKALKQHGKWTESISLWTPKLFALQSFTFSHNGGGEHSCPGSHWQRWGSHARRYQTLWPPSVKWVKGLAEGHNNWDGWKGVIEPATLQLQDDNPNHFTTATRWHFTSTTPLPEVGATNNIDRLRAVHPSIQLFQTLLKN